MSILLKSSLETEVYVSEYGFVVIRQNDVGEEAIVTLSPEQAEAVKVFIAENAEKQKHLWLSNGNEEEGVQA